MVVVELLLSERVGEGNNLSLFVPAYCPHAIPVIGFIDNVFETRGSKQVAEILDVAVILLGVVVDLPDVKKPSVVSCQFYGLSQVIPWLSLNGQTDMTEEPSSFCNLGELNAPMLDLVNGVSPSCYTYSAHIT